MVQTPPSPHCTSDRQLCSGMLCISLGGLWRIWWWVVVGDGLNPKMCWITLELLSDLSEHHRRAQRHIKPIRNWNQMFRFENSRKHQIKFVSLISPKM